MKTLSLKLNDDIFTDTETVLKEIKMPRNRYINEALAYYNRLQKKKIIAQILKNESKLVQEESMQVLGEFENMEEYDH